MEHVAINTVVLIHGLWMTALAWEHWVCHYEQRGFRVINPGYPGVEQGLAGVEALRRDPSPLADLGVREVFDHLVDRHFTARYKANHYWPFFRRNVCSVASGRRFRHGGGSNRRCGCEGSAGSTFQRD